MPDLSRRGRPGIFRLRYQFLHSSSDTAARSSDAILQQLPKEIEREHLSYTLSCENWIEFISDPEARSALRVELGPK